MFTKFGLFLVGVLFLDAWLVYEATHRLDVAIWSAVVVGVANIAGVIQGVLSDD